MKSNQEIIEKVRDLFAEEDFDEVMSVLDNYGDERWHHSKEQVQLAVLRMSNGKLDRLRKYMETARGDYRDVLLVAHEPNQFRVQMTSNFGASEEEMARAQQQDKEQFDAWLAGEPSLVCEYCSRVGVVPERRNTSEAGEPSSYQTPDWVTCTHCNGTGLQDSD